MKPKILSQPPENPTLDQITASTMAYKFGLVRRNSFYARNPGIRRPTCAACGKADSTALLCHECIREMDRLTPAEARPETRKAKILHAVRHTLQSRECVTCGRPVKWCKC